MQKTGRRIAPLILIPVLDEQFELPTCLSSVAGLPLIRRVTLMAGKTGFNNVMVLSGVQKERFEDPLGAVLAGTDARLTEVTAPEFQEADAPVLLLAPDCMPNLDFFIQLGEKNIPPDDILLWEDGQAMLLGASLRPAMLRHLSTSPGFGQLVNTLADTGEHIAPKKYVHEHVGISIREPEGLRAAETTLLRGLVKATEGWMARHINRKISLAVTRRLMHTSVTPNHMTWVSMAIGLLGAAFFLSPEHGMQIWGALFFLAHSILDGCDGELARLKFMESRLGGVFDFWSDNMVHIAVFAAMGVAWAAVSPDPFWAWLCAGLAVGGTAVSASLVYFHTMHAEKKSGPLYTSVSTSGKKSAVVRIADILSRRDFIYLVLLLALLNQTHWFLVMTAIGAPIYALLLIGIMARE